MAQRTEGDAETGERVLSRPPPTEDAGHHGDRLAINPVIVRLTQWLALAGGALMLASIAVTLLSVVGRYGFNAPVPGDYEIVELVCGVGIFLFFPYAHATGSNIVVEFFTLRVSRRRQRALDLVHEIVFAGVAALLAWRLSLGFAEKFLNGESTALVRIPFWWSYSFAVTSMTLLCIVCIARIFVLFQAPRT
jgi:TRAP-type C4-dicarboxylate transport system permease small subunit